MTRQTVAYHRLPRVVLARIDGFQPRLSHRTSFPRGRHRHSQWINPEDRWRAHCRLSWNRACNWRQTFLHHPRPCIWSKLFDFGKTWVTSLAGPHSVNASSSSTRAVMRDEHFWLFVAWRKASSHVVIVLLESLSKIMQNKMIYYWRSRSVSELRAGRVTSSLERVIQWRKREAIVLRGGTFVTSRIDWTGKKKKVVILQDIWDSVTSRVTCDIWNSEILCATLFLLLFTQHDIL